MSSLQPTKFEDLLAIVAMVFLLFAAPTGPALGAAPPAWPGYGNDSELFRIDAALGRNNGFTNALPDFVGPVDGTARLTIFTEGNHYPVLLPLVFEAFPQFCNQSKRCDLAPSDILVVTLPQVMIVEGLERGGFRFGNATLPVVPDGPVYPDIVMLGYGPMKRLGDNDVLAAPPRVLARHRGLGLLVARTHRGQIPDLEAFAASDLPFVMATPFERGARDQYLSTLSALLGDAETKALLSRESKDFPGRLAIQHRDVPYAILNELAPAGILFRHLADFYARRWPDRLAFVEVPEAAPFGTEILVALTRRSGAVHALRKTFLEFLFEQAPGAYEAAGFASADTFPFRQKPRPARR